MTVAQVDVVSDGSTGMPGNSSRFLPVPNRRKIPDLPKLNSLCKFLLLFLVLFHLSSKSEINYVSTTSFLHLIISEQ